MLDGRVTTGHGTLASRGFAAGFAPGQGRATAATRVWKIGPRLDGGKIRAMNRPEQLVAFGFEREVDVEG